MPRVQFQRGLQSLEDGVLEMGFMVDRQIERAMLALTTRDMPLASAVVRDDGEVNRTRFHLDNTCVSLLAQQAPMASDLRLIVAVLSIVSELERIGDHAEGIARIVLLMQDEPLVKPLIDLPKMAKAARQMLKDALDAFAERDLDAAYAVGPADDVVDQLYDRIYRDLVGIMTTDAALIEAATYLLWTAHNLERIADRATNVAERVSTLQAAASETPR